MDDAFGDALTVEVLHLFEECDILHEDWASWACGEGVLACDGCAVGGGHVGAFWCVGHGDLLGSIELIVM